MPRLEAGPGRFGIVASRKVGGAVERNRAKRLVREAMRQHLDLLVEPIDLVIIVRPGTHALGLAAIEAELSGVARLIRKRAAEVTQIT
jgi:ribonuclease P protein component